jgi:transmembrane sensor
MPMNPIERELLMRYLSGETSLDEQARVEAWLAEDPERWTQLAGLREELADAALSESAVDRAKAEVWARLRQEVGEAGNLGDSVPMRRSRARSREFAPASLRPWVTRGQLVAALVLAVVGGTVLGMFLLRWRPRPPTEAVQVATTAPGQRATFRLPDGSRVMLGVASTLHYPPGFSGGPREVSLEGEAYFEVVHDARRPFAVRAGDLVATDLGTEFTVRAYPEDAGARVVVREGRVAIRATPAGSPDQVVAPGQLGRLGRDRRPRVESADTAIWFAWTEGRLVLDSVPLREALPQLSRWFDLHFRLADSALGDVPLSATLRMQPTEDVLNNLAASLGLRQRRAGRTVTLYSAEPSH